MEPFTPLTNADVQAFIERIIKGALSNLVYIALFLVFSFLWRAVGPGHNRWAGGKKRERMSPDDIVKQQLQVAALAAQARVEQRDGVAGYDPREQWPIEWLQAEHGKAPVTDPGPMGWVVPDLMPTGPPPEYRWHVRWPTRARPLLTHEVKGYITTIVGGPGTGKSLLAQDYALASADPVVRGDWLGFPVEPCSSILYVDTELDPKTFWSRVFAIGRARLAAQAANGRAVPRKWRPKRIHYLRLHASLASWQGQLEIRRAVKRTRARRIVIDSATIGAWGLSPADQTGWRKTYTALEQIGLPIFIVDHLTKDGDKMYGSFIKEALIRSVLLCQAVDSRLVKVTHGKTNFGQKIDDFWFSKEFWQNDRGQLCVSFTRSSRGAEPVVESGADNDTQERELYMFELRD